MLRAEDTLVRLGDDELVAGCEDLGSADDAVYGAGRLMNAFAQTFAIAGVEVSVSASIGWLWRGQALAPITLRSCAGSDIYLAMVGPGTVAFRHAGSRVVAVPG